MDILLTDFENGLLIQPSSIHGALWLQMHFECAHWESLSNGEVIIPKEDGEILANDALQAGISVNLIPKLSYLRSSIES